MSPPPRARRVRSPFCSDEIVRSAFVAETGERERLEGKKEEKEKGDWRRKNSREKNQKHQFCKGATDRGGRCVLLFVGLSMLTTNITVSLSPSVSEN